MPLPTWEERRSARRRRRESHPLPVPSSSGRRSTGGKDRTGQDRRQAAGSAEGRVPELAGLLSPRGLLFVAPPPPRS